MRQIFRINYSLVTKEEATQLLNEVSAQVKEVPGRTTLANGLLAYWQDCETYKGVIRATIHKEDRRVQVIGLLK